MPAGQLLVLQILAATHPIDCIALLEIATPFAPKAMALTKSIGTHKPPVMIKVTLTGLLLATTGFIYYFSIWLMCVRCKKKDC